VNDENVVIIGDSKVKECKAERDLIQGVLPMNEALDLLLQEDILEINLLNPQHVMTMPMGLLGEPGCTTALIHRSLHVFDKE
jgi:hypothetical protein